MKIILFPESQCERCCQAYILNLFIFAYVCCCLECIGGCAGCYYEMIESCFDLRYLRDKPKLKKACVIGIMIILIIITIFLGGVSYSAFFGRHPMDYIIANFGLFLFHSLMGVLVMFAFVFACVLLVMCFCGGN